MSPISDSRFTHARWRKSRRSASSGQCVELAHTTHMTGVRDSKLGDSSPILAIGTTAWEAFLSYVKTSVHVDR